MYLGKKVRVFLKGQAKEAYFLLAKENNKESKSLLRSIDRVKKVLKENPQYGEPISKKLIPKTLIVEYNIKNLYRIELSNYWRMLYTLEGTQVEILLFVLNIVDHKEYNRLFGYK